MYCLKFKCTYIGVRVSLPPVISIGEEEGNVLICATLSSADVLEAGFTVSMTTRNGLGAAKVLMCCWLHSFFTP